MIAFVSVTSVMDFNLGDSLFAVVPAWELDENVLFLWVSLAQRWRCAEAR